MSSSLADWALPRLAKLLPLDDESLRQIITYTESLSKTESAEHLKNLLGDSAASLEFIAGFNTRRNAVGQAQEQADKAAGKATEPQAAGKNGNRREVNTGPVGGSKKNQKQKAPLHAPTQVRRPEGFGDVSGGYVKAHSGQDYIPGAPSSFSQTNQPSSSADTSRNQSPAGRRSGKLPPSASGQLISEFMPNVKSKKAKMSGSNTALLRENAAVSGSGSGSASRSSTTTTTTTTSNIADLTAAIAALEVSTNPKDRKERKCNCNADIHPLFGPAPNCMSCGKIICALEGLQPCSFCGAALLSATEIQDMIRELRAERGNEKMRAHNESVQGSSTPTFGGASAQSESKLDAAKAHRDKLLAFQAQNAQRTRIVDEAADYDIPTSSSTQWMTPAQRALALKKQQRLMREMEEKNRPEWERKSMVMSLDIKSGKVVRTFERAEVSTTPGKEEEDEADLGHSEDAESSGAASAGAFAHNPLLGGSGLVRPVWKPTGASQNDIQTRRREQKQTWRRVQDDNEDNEQWILDGGLKGHEREDDVLQCNVVVT